MAVFPSAGDLAMFVVDSPRCEGQNTSTIVNEIRAAGIRPTIQKWRRHSNDDRPSTNEHRSYRTMAYPGVPNSDDPALFEGIESSKTLKGWDLLMYKCRQQPLVPLGASRSWHHSFQYIDILTDIVGAAATVFALFGAARMGYKKNSKGMQYFFRARVAAQAFTVLALWAGIYVYEDDRKANNWRARERAEAVAKAKHVRRPLLVY